MTENLINIECSYCVVMKNQLFFLKEKIPFLSSGMPVFWFLEMQSLNKM